MQNYKGAEGNVVCEVRVEVPSQTIYLLHSGLVGLLLGLMKGPLERGDLLAQFRELRFGSSCLTRSPLLHLRGVSHAQLELGYRDRCRPGCCHAEE